MTVATLSAQQLTQAPISYRKNVPMLRAPQLAALRSAFTASMGVSDDRGWQHWAGIHGLPLPMYCQHHTPLFLAWHRAYLYYFELSLKEFEPTVTLPWWDWTLKHAEGMQRTQRVSGMRAMKTTAAAAATPLNV